MAFNFIKKVFSFGKQQVEERPAEDEKLPPLNFDALKALQPDALAEAPAKPAAEAVPEPVHVQPEAEAPVVEPEAAPTETDAQSEAVAELTPAAVPEPEPLAAGPAPVAAPPALQAEPETAPTVEVIDANVPESKAEKKPAKEKPQKTIAEAVVAPPVEPAAPSAAPAAPEAEARNEGARPVDPEPIAQNGPTPPPAVQMPAPAMKTPAMPVPKSEGPQGKVTVARQVEAKAEAPKPVEPAPRQNWFQRMRAGLSRSSRELSANIAGVFTKRKLDEDTLQDLEDVLIRADLGMETAIRITDALSSGRYGKEVSDAEVRTVMAEEVEKVLKPVALALELDLSHRPHVILVVGVNGTGKTTTIGKLAAKLVQGGLSVTLAAGDTFRAAAIEQLKIWGERTGSPVIASKLGADAAGLAFDAFEKAKAAGSDVLIIDTAGRLQNRTELMAELEKIVRVLGKLDPEAPHTVLQTVDATTGQNALNQVEIFRNVAGVNGLVMTKLDGTARGGILVAIAAKHKLPVYFIGVGEQVDDLEPFSAGEFARAIAGVG